MISKDLLCNTGTFAQYPAITYTGKESEKEQTQASVREEEMATHSSVLAWKISWASVCGVPKGQT